MSQYSAEAVPISVESELAEFLDRQLNLIAIALQTLSETATATEVSEAPDEDTPKVAGAFINVKQHSTTTRGAGLNGVWGCMYNDSGELEWKRYLPEEPPEEP